MKDILQEILDWSEAWAPLLALIAALIFKPKKKWVRPLIWFLVLAFLVNLTSDIIWKRYHLGLREWMKANFAALYDKPPPGEEEQLSNQVLYNAHSILRFLFFAWFFHTLAPVFRRMNRVLIPVFLVSMFVVFYFYKDIRELSSLLMASDSALLLIYCLVWYFLFLRDEESSVKGRPEFWAVLGISVYVVVNFPIFLFYTVVSKQSENFAIDIWDVHNISYIIFCIFLALSFYAARQHKGNLTQNSRL